MRYSVIAAQDGSVYHDDVEAVDQEEAETKAREQLAEAWGMKETLDRALAEGDPTQFDAELDGFAVDPNPDVLAIVAETFRDAKDAPTSFEDEQWLDGFEDGRQLIAERLALQLRGLPGFDAEQFLRDCQIEIIDELTDEEKADQKHNAQMLDGCETEDERNTEMRHQTQGR